MLLTEMRIFYYVVECGGFSKAATRMGVSKSYVSKKIHKLESVLAIDLIHRDSRRLRLTTAGEKFFISCQEVVQQGQAAYDGIAELKGTPSGELKISLPPAVAEYLIEPILASFVAEYPQIKLDFHCESKLVNLAQEGYDLALRSAVLDDSLLVARKFLSFQHYACTTKAYLAQHKLTDNEEDVSKLNFIMYSGTQNKLTIADKHETHVPINGSIKANNLALMKSSVLNHLGVAVFPDYVVKKELATGQLIKVLQTLPLAYGSLYAIYPKQQFTQPTLRAFLDYLFKAMESS